MIINILSPRQAIGTRPQKKLMRSYTRLRSLPRLPSLRSFRNRRNLSPTMSKAAHISKPAARKHPPPLKILT